MAKQLGGIAVAMAMLVGCVSSGPSGDVQDRSQLAGASHAVQMGQYGLAEQRLAQYAYRDKDGRLKIKYFGISGDNRKHAIDTVVSLLWETGRDDTLKQFSHDYLAGSEYQTTLCRISERQAKYEEAYHCWNDIGEVDRAERVIRTEAALRILGTP
ncbi:hypothetical protein [Pseudomonas mosselii]|uniref:hypothetical protein n=1 Tax=Pseudomonas mosselii TaxID=78327 RepID=UPI0021D8102D|nr:hypothetical protein [Pseudomonas mosselii]MCU9528121.1 hypothetical protein [Pseudomonas mosselii]MCU9535229.1 hypothetical protein [Pseudomonas mosselii]MCU9542949.1 hypothetical protein [Pseudomonas mosselii]MCU9546965.1 hypothetical protein [Pseudomonas mosselii]